MPIVEARSGAAVVGARRSLMPALGTWGFIVTFSGQGLRNLVGWWAFGVIAAISGLMLFAVFVREGHRVPWRALPPIASAYTVLCMLSVIWSHYPRETILAGLLMLATTASGVLLACGLSLRQLTDALSRALEATLVLSFLLELYVALVLQHPLIPAYMRDWTEVPPSYIWVEGNIFRGGPIQGIVGNRNPLAFIALLTLICVAEGQPAEIAELHRVVCAIRPDSLPDRFGHRHRCGSCEPGRHVVPMAVAPRSHCFADHCHRRGLHSGRGVSRCGDRVALATDRLARAQF